MLTEEQIMDAMRAALWVGFSAALPLLVVALVVGLTIGLTQALTSVQELTLTFVPKLGAIAIGFWLSMGYMTELIVSLWRDRLIPLIGGG